MFSNTVRRLLCGLLIIAGLGLVFGAATYRAPEPEPEPDIELCTFSEPEDVSETPLDELTSEEAAEPAPVELRYAHLALTISQEEKGLMALAVYHESRGEPHGGQRAVAETILNRVLSVQFPDTVKEVIYQDGQFDCAGALLSEAIREPGALANCFDVVDEVLMESEYAIPEYYCFFSTGRPKTSDYIQIGNHYFR